MANWKVTLDISNDQYHKVCSEAFRVVEGDFIQFYNTEDGIKKTVALFARNRIVSVIKMA